MIFLLLPSAYRFDLEMKGYGFNVEELKAPTPKRKFHTLHKELEKSHLKKNDVVAETCLCKKYKGLAFWYPDDECLYTVYDKNLEWTHGQGNM